MADWNLLLVEIGLDETSAALPVISMRRTLAELEDV
jgi:hypothetical protein